MWWLATAVTVPTPQAIPRDASELGNALLEVLGELVAELHPQRRVATLSLDSLLDRDIGLDSLARVELFSRLERRFNISLPEEALVSAETARDLLRALRAAMPQVKVSIAPHVIPEAGETVGTPSHAQTLLEVLDWYSAAVPTRTAIRLWKGGDDDEAISYAALRREAEAVAVALQERGVRSGQSIAIMLPTSRGYYASFFGVLIAGAIPVPLYPPARPSQIDDHLRRHIAILNNCQAVALITVPEARTIARLLRSQTERLRHVLAVEELTATAGVPARPVVSADDIAFLQYTSGSTGAPKGVVLTHANLLANLRTMGALVQVTPADVFVSWLPLYHDMGLIGAWLGSLYFGATLVNLSPLTFLTRPYRWFEAIHRYRATLTAGPNFAYGLCVRKIEPQEIAGIDLSSLRIAFNGAEPISAATLNAFCETFAEHGFRRAAMMPVYGLAECSLGLTFPPLGRGPRIDRLDRGRLMKEGRAVPVAETGGEALEVVGCGRVLPGHALRIIDEVGREVGEREEGTLEFRGPSATSGYYRNAAATRKLFHDGWLDSGDRAYLADGEVFITGRTKDVIIRAGRNIFPQELEDAIGDVQGIRKGNVAVFAARPPGADIEKLVVLAETRTPDPADHERLRQAINELALARIGTVPDDIVLATTRAVLKTSSGKIRRAASRELYERHKLGTPGAPVRWQLFRLALAGWRPVLWRAGRRAAGWLYSAYANAIFIVLGAVVWLGVIGLPKQTWRWQFGSVMIRLGAWLCALRLELQGEENLPRPGRKAIVVANHASYLDAFALVALCPGRFRFVAKSEFAKSALLGPFMRRLGTEFVERFDVRRSVADAERLADRIRVGPSLLYFPEGTFTRVSGLRPFRMGAFVAAASAEVPVVPIAIRGTRNILRERGWLIRRGRVALVVGAPIEPPPAGDIWARALVLRDTARGHILRHCGESDLSGEQD